MTNVLWDMFPNFQTADFNLKADIFFKFFFLLSLLLVLLLSHFSCVRLCATP